MTAASDLRHGRHVVFNLHVHLVFVPKYRRRVFAETHLARMRLMFADVCRDFGATLVEMNAEDTHAQLLIDYPPHVSVSTLVNSLKGVSSRRLRREFRDLTGHYYKGVLWSPSYFAASCGGAPLSILTHYLERQQTPKSS